MTDPGIHDALPDLLGEPVAECDALRVPTAAYGHPHVTPAAAWRFAGGREPRTPVGEPGRRPVGVLEVTAPPTAGRYPRVPRVREADVLPAGGGDALYLCRWMRRSGPAGPLPSLRDTVRVGLSAGSTVTAPRIGEHLVEREPSTGATAHRGPSASRSSRTWTTRPCRGTPRPMPGGGRPGPGFPRARSTTGPP